MNVATHPNPITRSAILAKGSLPKGAGQHKQRANFTPSAPRRGNVEKHVGIKLVKWFLAQDMKQEARDLLSDIREGKVSPF